MRECFISVGEVVVNRAQSEGIHAPRKKKPTANHVDHGMLHQSQQGQCDRRCPDTTEERNVCEKPYPGRQIPTYNACCTNTRIGSPG